MSALARKRPKGCVPFKRGWDAMNNAEYRQLRRNPEAITAAALDALARKFNLPLILPR